MDRRTDDFAAFVADCDQQLRGTALLLTGDPAQADDLVVAALARTHRRWRRLASPADALADTRASLVTAALDGTGPAASHGSIGTLPGTGDDRADGERLDPDDRRWLAALAGLDPTARAVVVLRLVEGQDEETVARLLGRSPEEVADALDTAVAILADLLAAEPEPATPQPAWPVAAPLADPGAAAFRRPGAPAGDPDAAFRRPDTSDTGPRRPAVPGPSGDPTPVRDAPAGDPDAVFRRPGAPPPPVRPAPAPAAPSAGALPPDDGDDPWAIYRRPT
ncbi:hypothetical protein [Modestobacter sp. SSW1-42]|uniref:hypothetical protein n=1 Tax=Modestobacter sp. SSW1-42 TaxID=596372 RepID=UPI003985AB77